MGCTSGIHDVEGGIEEKLGKPRVDNGSVPGVGHHQSFHSADAVADAADAEKRVMERRAGCRNSTGDEPTSPCTLEPRQEVRQNSRDPTSSSGRCTTTSAVASPVGGGQGWLEATSGEAGTGDCAAECSGWTSSVRMEQAALAGNLKQCLVCILFEAPCSLLQVKRRLVELQQRYPEIGVPRSNEQLSVLLRQISCYRTPGLYVLKEEWVKKMAHEEQPMSMMVMMKDSSSLLRRAIAECGTARREIMSHEEYEESCREYESKHEVYFRLHQHLRWMTETTSGDSVAALHRALNELHKNIVILQEQITKYKRYTASCIIDS